MTPASVLYSLRSEIDAEGAQRYRITKFTDGEVESSYHTSREACECPAGVRPTCRHRQMLPHMLNAQIVNTHWFMLWPEAQVVDFEGTTRAAYERALALAETAPEATFTTQPHSTTVSATDFDSVDGGSNPPAVANHSWRRM